jgi:hypothetical protein
VKRTEKQTRKQSAGDCRTSATNLLAMRENKYPQ